MAKTTKSQNIRVLETLRNVGSITAARAQTRGIQNLRARICELRDGGEKIKTVPYTRKDGVVAAKYVLNG